MSRASTRTVDRFDISVHAIGDLRARPAGLVRAASDERRNLQKSRTDRDKRARPMFAN